MTAPLLEVRGLAKWYESGAVPSLLARLLRPRGRRRHAALQDVSFSVGRGEVVGVVGRNGAGKSTLLRILSRITRPSAGEVDIHGRAASLLEVGTGFHPDLTGRENVWLSGPLIGLRREQIARRFEAIVDFAGVGEEIDSPVRHYSSGMYVRLAYALAAQLEADILFLDEVLAVGDQSFRARCLGQLRRAHEAGRAALIVTHDLGLLGELCQRALLLEKGRLLADGPPQAVVQEYLRVLQDAPA